jgi:AbrB family looped-hinge helix DNA binding protein
MKTFLLAMAFALAVPATALAADDDAKKNERRETILKMRDATLERLQKEKPESKDLIAKAPGYAVFDATGVNVVLYVGGKGAGVLVDNATGKPTYMTMVRAGTGPGLGYKEFKQIIVFKTKKAVEMFLSAGIDVGSSFDFGSVMQKGQSFNPDFALYTITDKGFTVQANWGGRSTSRTRSSTDGEKDPGPGAPRFTGLQNCCNPAIISTMKSTVTITARGVVTLPAKLREAMGLKADDLLIAETTPEGILLRPAVTLPIETYSTGACANSTRPRRSSPRL